MGNASAQRAAVLAAHISGQSNKPLTRPPHSLSSAQVLEELNSDPTKGLDPDEVPRRLEEYGPNQLDEKAGVQPLKIFFEQIFNAMTLVGWTAFEPRVANHN